MILIGEAKERIEPRIREFDSNVMVETLEEAVQIAYQHAKAGDIILLSPACSSFDMFKDYKERGRVFKEIVSRL